MFFKISPENYYIKLRYSDFIGTSHDTSESPTSKKHKKNRKIKMKFCESLNKFNVAINNLSKRVNEYIDNIKNDISNDSGEELAKDVANFIENPTINEINEIENSNKDVALIIDNVVLSEEKLLDNIKKEEEKDDEEKNAELIDNAETLLDDVKNNAESLKENILESSKTSMNAGVLDYHAASDQDVLGGAKQSDINEASLELSKSSTSFEELSKTKIKENKNLGGFMADNQLIPEEKVIDLETLADERVKNLFDNAKVATRVKILGDEEQDENNHKDDDNVLEADAPQQVEQTSQQNELTDEEIGQRTTNLINAISVIGQHLSERQLTPNERREIFNMLHGAVEDERTYNLITSLSKAIDDVDKEDNLNELSPEQKNDLKKKIFDKAVVNMCNDKEFATSKWYQKFWDLICKLLHISKPVTISQLSEDTSFYDKETKKFTKKHEESAGLDVAENPDERDKQGLAPLNP